MFDGNVILVLLDGNLIPRGESISKVVYLEPVRRDQSGAEFSYLPLSEQPKLRDVE
jgi:hypothetical protein